MSAKKESELIHFDKEKKTTTYFWYLITLFTIFLFK